INGMVINNVNTSKPGMIGWKIISPEYIEKLVPLAELLRSYGIKTYISVSFAAPMRVGGLETADPLDADVASWWADTADRIYSRIPDFGGFLVKADSEGEPGPHSYERDHSQGANVLAAALKPYGGIVLWRAFVYGGAASNKDRAAQAFELFKPLDGRFADNVIVQIKNGPVDFQVREPVAPLFGQMPETNLMIELQVTQEYTGHATHLCYLVPQWKSFLGFDTHANGSGTTLARIVDGSAHGYKHAGITGVSNFGDQRNWTGHHLAQANAYGYGRLAWNPGLTAEKITDEWVKMTFGTDPAVVEIISKMMLGSWKVYEDYTSPLGVGVMCDARHYGPNPKGRVAFHHADPDGVGYDRTAATGSGYAAQYHMPVAKRYESLESCPDEHLLFFHHVPYTHRLHSGKTVIQHIYDSHIDGVQKVEESIVTWHSLKGRIDDARYEHVLSRLERQFKDAVLWRDSINQYFLVLSGVEHRKGSLGQDSAASVPDPVAAENSVAIDGQ
ncbi:MAG: alpha-glucuronidase, partial [Verrucomicrobia bacterium]